jgi:hypothetical protein
VEACSKRQRLDSSAPNFPAFSDASLKNPNMIDEGHLTEVGSLVSHLAVERSEARNNNYNHMMNNSHNVNQHNNVNHQQNQHTMTHEGVMITSGGGGGCVSVGHPPAVNATHVQTQISADTTGEAQTKENNNTTNNNNGTHQNQDDGPCRSGILGGQVYFSHLVKSMMQTTSTET